MEPDKRKNMADAIQLAANVNLNRLMMKPENVLSLYEAGMGIGGHTKTHPILARLDEKEASEEIGGGKEELEAIIGNKVSLFAYPNGKPGVDYIGMNVKAVINSGYEAAVSTAWGYADRRSDVYQLPRFLPWDKAPTKFALRIYLNYLREQSQFIVNYDNITKI
jgi:peptidoglycan/xylan/chitin deacetylase (PgdA/CDA1 family)